MTAPKRRRRLVLTFISRVRKESTHPGCSTPVENPKTNSLKTIMSSAGTTSSYQILSRFQPISPTLTSSGRWKRTDTTRVTNPPPRLIVKAVSMIPLLRPPPMIATMTMNLTRKRTTTAPGNVMSPV